MADPHDQGPTPSFDDLEFERFDPGEHEIEAFDCGREELNEFINSNDARPYQENRLGATTLVSYEGNLAAYYTLAPTALTEEDYTGDEHPKADHLYEKPHSIPRLLIGRFAVKEGFQGIGLGALLVDYLIAWSLEQRDLLFRVIVLHAKEDVVGFYERCGFVESESKKSKQRSQKTMFYVLDPLTDL